MADIVVTAANVGRSDPFTDTTVQGLAAVAITAGQVVYMNATGGLAIADGSAAGTAEALGVAMNGAGIGGAVTVLKEGECTGFTLAGNYGTFLYLSDTAGALADAAGTVSKVLGKVFTKTDHSLTKVAFIEANWSVPGV